jgi:hypothetical protein
MKAILTLIVLFVLTDMDGQNQQDALKMNDGISPISLYAGYSNDIWNQGRLTPGYEYNREEDYSFIIGTEYIFAKTGKFQFTLGAYYKKSKTTGDLFVPGSSLGVEEDFSLSINKEYGLLQVPLKVAFIQRITPNLYVNLNGGVSYADLFHDNMLIEGSLIVEDEQVINFRSADAQNVARIQFEMGARFLYKSQNSGLYGLEFMYHIGTIIAEDTILSENIPNEQEYVSIFRWDGKYTSVNFHWSPPKSWFQKKQ